MKFTLECEREGDGLYEALAAQIGLDLLAADDLLARSAEVSEFVTGSGKPLDGALRGRATSSAGSRAAPVAQATLAIGDDDSALVVPIRGC